MKQLLLPVLLMTAIYQLNAQNVGIGTETPGEKLEVNGNIRISPGAARTLSVTQAAVGVAGNPLTISAGSTTLSETGAYDGGDLLLFAGKGSNPLGRAAGNIILTTGINYHTQLNGNPTARNGDIIFRGGLNPGNYNSVTEFARMDGTTGFWGFGTSTPTASVDVVGTVKTTGLQLTTGATNGFVLRSDANGVASWVNATSLPITENDPQVGANTSNYLSKWNGTALVSAGVFESGGNVGIGTASPQGKLDVNGSIKTTGLQLTTGATNGFVLRSDANGIASWVNSNSLPITETDPQVGANTTNYLSKWNGTALVSAAVFENGGNVGLGTSSPSNRLSVSGNMDVTGSMGVATSTPAAKMDVNGNFKLGASGTVINNIIKFSADFGYVTVPPHNTSVVTVSPIQGAVVGSTVFASPSVPLPPGMSIYCRVVSDTVVELFFVNGSDVTQKTPNVKVFFTVIN